MLGRVQFRVVGGALEFRAGIARSPAEVFDAQANQFRVEIGGSGDIATFRFPDAGGPADAVQLVGQEFTRVTDPR